MPQSQWIPLLIAAMVAAAVLVRLYWVLGRRSGAEQQAPAPGWRGGEVMPPQPAPALPGQGAPGLFDIQLADKKFDAAKFLEGARTAYRQIVTAFETGDRDALKPLVSGEVYDGFTAAIDARGAPGIYHLADIREARITGASVEAGVMEIVVSFTAAFDTADAVGAPHEVTDVWTFTRAVGAADLNWTLAATSGDVP